MAEPTLSSIPAAPAPARDACPDLRTRLQEIRRLVQANNRSCLAHELIVCQIYMESRFDACAQPPGSSARGLMQLLKVANRELFRLDNLGKPLAERCPEDQLYARADAFHDSPAFIDEATDIQSGTRYLQLLIDRARHARCPDPVAEAYKDYRGVRNGIYYQKIRAAAEKLKRNPEGLEAFLGL
jgi:hypothetical protein